MAKTRSSSANRQAMRKSSILRGERRKEERRRANQEAAQKNRELRAQGLPTAHEIRVAAYRARREARIAAAIADGTYRAPVYNERGFAIEVVDGKTVLRDTGNWQKRRNKRFGLISDGKLKVTDAWSPSHG